MQLNIGRHIYELLNDHDYVILPGIGAFFSRYRPSRADEGGKVLHPPSRIVVFNPDMKNNDGVLLNYLAHHEGITAPRAHVMLENLKDELLYRLDHGESVHFEMVGTLSRIAGSLEFKAGQDAFELPEAFGLKPVKLQDRKAEKTRKEETGPLSRSDLPPSAKRKWLVPVLALVLLLVAAVPVLLYRNTLKEGEYNKPALPAGRSDVTEIRETIPEPAGHAAADTIPEVIQESPEEIKHPVNGKFYVIGGSFKEFENVDKYLTRAVSEGFDPVYLGEINQFYVVAVGCFDTESEAVILRNMMLRKDSAAGAWVYHHTRPE